VVADFVGPIAHPPGVAREASTSPKTRHGLMRKSECRRARRVAQISVYASGVRGYRTRAACRATRLEMPLFDRSKAWAAHHRVSRSRSHSSRTRPCESNTNAQMRCHRSVSLIVRVGAAGGAPFTPCDGAIFEYSRNNPPTARQQEVRSSTSASVLDPPCSSRAPLQVRACDGLGLRSIEEQIEARPRGS